MYLPLSLQSEGDQEPRSGYNRVEVSCPRSQHIYIRSRHTIVTVPSEAAKKIPRSVHCHVLKLECASLHHVLSRGAPSTIRRSGDKWSTETL